MTKNKKMKKREKSRKTPNITRVPAFDILRIVILDASKSKRALKTSLKNKKLI